MSSPNLCFDVPTINARGVLARKLYAATGLSASKLRRKKLRRRVSRYTVHRYSVVRSNRLDLAKLLNGSDRYGLSFDRVTSAICKCNYGRQWRQCNSYLVFDNGNGKVDSKDVFFVVDSYMNVAGGKLGDSSVTIETNSRSRKKDASVLKKLRKAAEQFMRNIKQNHFSSSFANLDRYMYRLKKNINTK